MAPLVVVLVVAVREGGPLGGSVSIVRVELPPSVMAIPLSF